MTDTPPEPRFLQPGEIDDAALDRGRVRVMALGVEEILRRMDSHGTILKLIQEAILDLRGQVSHAFEQLGRMDGRQDALTGELRQVRRHVDELERRVTELERLAADAASGR